ncbi:MAG: FHA domain-containing protein [Tannerellaceae bacterium]|jgi:serine/threonine protein kinase|nr:FHA domain-containing protein [Tannerellaceae bacterium]
MFHNFIVQRGDYSPGQRIGGGRYCVEQLIGESPVWKVFRVRQTSGIISTFKLLKLWEVTPVQRQDWINRFNIEYKTGQPPSLYLSKIIDSGEEGGNPFILMEYGERGNLSEFLASHSPVNVRLIAESVLNGLNDLHVNGHAHRNLKPANIMIRRDGSAFLADFDFEISEACNGADYALRSRLEAAACLAPELTGAKRTGAKVFPASDMFAFGVMLYHLLTRQYPFGLPDDPVDLRSYRNRCIEGKWNRKLLHGVADEPFWRKIIEGCLSPDYVARFHSAAGVIALLPPDTDASGAGAGADAAADTSGSLIPEALFPLNIPPAVAPQMSLRVTEGSEPGKVYTLNSLLQKSRVITVGRGSRNMIGLREQDTSFISRVHCTIETNENHTKWIIRDGQLVIPDGGQRGVWKTSTNGTFVDSKRISVHGVALKAGSVIKLGATTLQVEESRPV